MASIFSGLTGSNTTRPLVIHSKAARLSIPVPASPLSAWVASEVLAQEFHDSRAGLDEEVEVEEELEEGAVRAPASNEPQVKLLARFLSFVASKASSGSEPELAQVLLAAYSRFNELFLSTSNIHSIVQSFDVESRTEILAAYFKAFTTARQALGDKEVPVAHPSALLEAAKDGKAELYGLFGGQGVNEVSLTARQVIADDARHISTSCKHCTTSIPHSSILSFPTSPTASSFLFATMQRRMDTPTTLRVSTSSHGSTGPLLGHQLITSHQSLSLCLS
jgi:fatty acid synthase subunit beta